MTAIDNGVRETEVRRQQPQYGQQAQQTQPQEEHGVLPARPLNHAEHYAYYGALPSPDRLPLGELAALLGHAGVRGRGGAGFPLYRKIVSVSGAARARKLTPVIVANGCEGEPASHKDKHLLWLAPHLVLDGLVLLGRELRATRAILAIEAGAPNGRGDLVRRLREAVKERDVRQDGVSIELVEVPGRFIAGESAALVSTLNGGPGMPAYTENSVREQGVGDAPTLVQNVETVAQVALIARYGADWFRDYGTAAEPGPQLFTVYPGRNRARVVHSAAGAPLYPLIADAEAFDAVLIGGYHGSWIPAPLARRARLTAADLGVPLGAGLIAALPADRCGIAETAHIVQYLALESAGQCGPCLNGLPRIAAALEKLADPQLAARDQGLIETLERWCGMVEGRGLCHHPDGSVRLVRSALMTFRTEIAAHRAGVCTGGDPRPLLPAPTRELVH